MPDDHSDVVPLLPIPNRTVKRVSADDSAGSRVKVGHRQALTAWKSPTQRVGLSFLCEHPKSVHTKRQATQSLLGGAAKQLQAAGSMSRLPRRPKKKTSFEVDAV